MPGKVEAIALTPWATVRRVLEQAVDVGLVVELGRRRAPVELPRRRVRTEQPVEQRAQMRVLHGGDQLAHLELHRLGRVRRAVDEVGEGERARGGLADLAQLELRAEARVDLEAPAHVDGAPGLAELAQLGRGVARDGGEPARAVGERELEQLRAVAPGARLARAHEQDLVQVLAVGEVAYEHEELP